MSVLDLGQIILKEIDKSFSHIDKEVVEDLLTAIKSAHNVFFIGAGRSRLILNAFCMRLNHLGFNAYVAGNIPCPPIQKGDILIAASGSGKTPSIISVIEKVRAEAIPIFFITAAKKELFKNTDTIIRIDSPSELLHTEKTESTQLMRTLFEQTVFILFEALVLQMSKDEPHEKIAARHTNLE